MVFRCIDETLAGVLGFVVRDSLYLRLLTNLSVTRDDLPKHLDGLQTILDDSFGVGPAKVLSRAIARRLYSELQLTFVDNPKFGLPEYVAEAKGKLLETTSRTANRSNTEISVDKKDSPFGG